MIYLLFLWEEVEYSVNLFFSSLSKCCVNISVHFSLASESIILTLWLSMLCHIFSIISRKNVANSFTRHSGSSWVGKGKSHLLCIYQCLFQFDSSSTNCQLPFSHVWQLRFHQYNMEYDSSQWQYTPSRGTYLSKTYLSEVYDTNILVQLQQILLIKWQLCYSNNTNCC